MRALIPSLFLSLSTLATPALAAVHDAAAMDRVPAATPTQIDYSAALNRQASQLNFRSRMQQSLRQQAAVQLAEQSAQLLDGLATISPVRELAAVTVTPQWSPVQVALRTSCEHTVEGPLAADWNLVQPLRVPVDCIHSECVYL